MTTPARLRLLRSARDDITSIAAAILRDDLLAAVRFTDAVERNLLSLLDHPRIGPAYPVADPRLDGLRKLDLGGRFRAYLLFYLIRRGRVVVVRVLDGRRDLPRLFRRRG